MSKNYKNRQWRNSATIDIHFGQETLLAIYQTPTIPLTIENTMDLIGKGYKMHDLHLLAEKGYAYCPSRDSFLPGKEIMDKINQAIKYGRFDWNFPDEYTVDKVNGHA